MIYLLGFKTFKIGFENAKRVYINPFWLLKYLVYFEIIRRNQK